MNIKIQIIDTKNGITQYGSIEEPNIEKGFEINHALKTFGIEYATVNWMYNETINSSKIMVGSVLETSKIVTIVCI